MIQQRKRGIYLIFSGIFLLGNMTLFIGWILLLRALSGDPLFGATSTFTYLLSIPIAYLLSTRVIWEIFSRVDNPSHWKCLMGTVRYVACQATIIFFIYFMLKDVQSSRALLLLFLGISLLINWHLFRYLPVLLFRALVNDSNRLGAILVGNGGVPTELQHYLTRSNHLGVRVLGHYADKATSIEGIPYLGKLEEVSSFGSGRSAAAVDLVFAYASNVNDPDFKEAVDQLLRLGLRVQIYSNLTNAFQDPVRIVTDGSIHFLSFYDEPLQNPVNVTIKRAADIAISLPVVLGFLPFLAGFVWLGQRFQSPGPLLYKQTRYGINRRPFTIYKFRSMHVSNGDDEAQQATKGDARIYRFGAFLRKSSLDEFPQFINVLLGEMSVVGPRPHLTTHDEVFEKVYRRYRSRHFVKPGITGLAQVQGCRGEATTPEHIVRRVEHDISYITQWTISREFQIVFKTAWQLIFPPKSAY